MAVAELAGAAIFVATEDNVRRAALSCFGLGFAICIVLADIVPDATEDYSPGWLFLAAGFLIGLALMFSAGERRPNAGRAAAIAGMALYNICEGIVIVSAGPAASVLVPIGADAHKLPEGMVVFSLADRLSIGRRWLVAVLVLATSLMMFAPIGRWQTALLSRGALAATTAGGAVPAGLTCLVI
jgi:ZIP family zinc transporter